MITKTFIAASLLLFAFTFLAPVSGIDISKAEVEQLIQEGTRLFEAGNALLAENPGRASELYAGSLLHFERAVLDGGIRNGKLYYNIGNTYYRLGEIGYAILNYRRALRLMPTDTNLLQNLGYARSRRLDTIEEAEEKQALALVLFWHYRLPFRVRLAVFTVCIGLFWICAGIKFIFGRKVYTWLLVIIAIPAVIFLASLIADSIGGHDEGVIVAKAVIARKGNAETYQPSFSEPLHAGTEFALIERRGGWLYIELLDGRKSWIREESSELLFPTS